MNASDVMQKGLVFVSPELPIDQFEELLTGEEIGGAPVIDRNGALVGVASKTDIVRGLSEEVSQRADAMLKLGAELTVGDIMSPDVVTVTADQDVRSIARTMTEGRLHRVLVANDEEVLGIITSLDLVKLLT